MKADRGAGGTEGTINQHLCELPPSVWCSVSSASQRLRLQTSLLLLHDSGLISCHHCSKLMFSFLTVFMHLAYSALNTSSHLLLLLPHKILVELITTCLIIYGGVIGL